MADALKLQDWITIAGNNNVVIQNEQDWAEIPDAQDAAFYLDLANASSTAATNIDLQTSPTRDDGFFAGTVSANPYVARFPVTNLSFGVQALQFVRWAGGSATTPLARFLRWRVTFPSGGITSVTFRLWCSFNPAAWRCA